MLFRKRRRPEPPVVHAGDDDFGELVEDAEGIAVVDFWAPWCQPCKIMGPLLDEVAVEQEGRGVRVVKVDVDQAPETAARYGIRSVPTLMFFRDGEPLFEMVGLVPKPVVLREIEALRAGESGPDSGEPTRRPRPDGDD